MGNCFAKNKLPGCFKLKRRPRDSIFYQRNPIFSHYVNLVALIPQRARLGASWPWLRGQGPGAGLAVPPLPGAGSWRGPLRPRTSTPPTPCTLAAHHQGVFISMERGLREVAVAVAPNLGAPGWASCSWGRLGRSRNSTTSICFLLSFFCVWFFFSPHPPCPKEYHGF